MHAVVREENVLLERVDLDAGVVLNARTGDVEALRTEVEQRLVAAVEDIPVAIDDGVVDLVERGPRNLRRRCCGTISTPLMYSGGMRTSEGPTKISHG